MSRLAGWRNHALSGLILGDSSRHPSLGLGQGSLFCHCCGDGLLNASNKKWKRFVWLAYADRMACFRAFHRLGSPPRFPCHSFFLRGETSLRGSQGCKRMPARVPFEFFVLFGVLGSMSGEFLRGLIFRNYSLLLVMVNAIAICWHRQVDGFMVLFSCGLWVL